MAGHYIRSAILVSCRTIADELGEDMREIADSAGLDPRATIDPDIPIPAAQVIECLERAANVWDCPSFGLRAGAQADMAVVGPLWLLLREARSVYEMLEDFATNFDLFTSDVGMTLNRCADGALLTWAAGTHVGVEHVQAAEYSLATCCAELRRHGPRGWQPQGVYFQHSAPNDVSCHRQIFGSNLIFDHELNAIFIDSALLSKPLRDNQFRRRELIYQTLRGGLKRAAEKGLAERVDIIVRTRLPYVDCTLKDVASDVAVAPRTLQAMLQRQGTSFARVKDTARSELALKYLRHSNLTVGEIAEILGYSEISAFSRTFRRWYGRAPREERRRHNEASSTQR